VWTNVGNFSRPQKALIQLFEAGYVRNKRGKRCF